MEFNEDLFGPVIASITLIWAFFFFQQTLGKSPEERKAAQKS